MEEEPFDSEEAPYPTSDDESLDEDEANSSDGEGAGATVGIYISSFLSKLLQEYSVPPVAWPGLSALERGVCYGPAEYMRSGKTTPFIPTIRTPNSTTTFARPLLSTLTARIPFPCCCPGAQARRFPSPPIAGRARSLWPAPNAVVALLPVSFPRPPSDPYRPLYAPLSTRRRHSGWVNG